MSAVAQAASLPARAAVIATATMFGLTYSLSAALIALSLAGQGLSEAMIGANAAMHAVGVLLAAMLLPRSVARFGIRRLIIAALAVAAAVLLGFPALPLVWIWFLLRLLLGMCSEVLFVLSEAWTNSLSTEATRARAMAAYTAALSVGFALGPLILSLVGTMGFAPYLIGAGITLAAACFIASPRVPAPQFEKPAPGSPIRFMRMAPVAIAATMLNAGIETAGLSFLAIYAVNLGWPTAEATQLMSVMMVGAILLQLPIGWLGDKMDRMTLVAALALIAAAGALVWPLALGSQWATYALLFVWGGAFVGIYALMLTVVGSRFQGAELIGIYAAMGLMWGLGAFIGPLAAGLAMEWAAHGLAFFAAAMCGGFALFVIARRRRG
ncbi:MFS transporter [Roseomonas frigidaquae]|uniref:MFS transporter n=1 Tax=Falsiroseomonas frigidaquae TaxID=487318 RepID=A0ABX1EW08_9PROT|nr:MFS transporter [Falsiroseomonas frigidaquae]NKE43610.1 MFS transporter [Falsiroseomonas frigidaquae]